MNKFSNKKEFSEKLERWKKLEREGENPLEVLRREDWTSGDIQIVEYYEGIIPVKDFLRKKMDSGKILDIGCGSGKHTILFAEEGFKSYGIDISESGIQLSKKISEWKGLEEKTNFLLSDVMNLPFKKEEFNVVIDHNLLCHIPISRWEEYLKSVNRVLNTGGFLCLLELYKTEAMNGSYEEMAENNSVDVVIGENKIKRKFCPPFRIEKIIKKTDRVEENEHIIIILQKIEEYKRNYESNS